MTIDANARTEQALETAPRLDGKVALVTGGGSGIGRATARALAAAGAQVAVADISIDAARETCALIGETAAPLVVDVASAASVEAMFDALMERFGRLDVGVNNAGITTSATQGFEATTEEEFDRMVAVNFKGVWLCMKREIAIFRGAGARGAIVNTASMLGLVGAGPMPVYSATKHAIVGLTRSAALEHSRNGIRVNAICPGAIDTPLVGKAQLDPDLQARMAGQHPIGRLGAPEEIARAIVWLASPMASFVAGAAVPVDGGWTAA